MLALLALSSHCSTRSLGLDTLVDVREIQAPISEVLADISSKVGVALFAEPSLQDRTVNLICNSRKASEVLEAISGCLMLKTKPDGKGIKFFLDPIEEREEKDQMVAEDAEATMEMAALFERLKAFRSKNVEELGALELAALRGQDDLTKSNAERKVLVNRARDLQDPELAYLSNSVGFEAEDAASALVAGQRLYFSTLPTRQSFQLDPTLQSWASYSGQAAHVNISLHRLSWDPVTMKLQRQGVLESDVLPGQVVSTSPTLLSFNLKPPETKLLRLLEEWQEEGDEDLQSINIPRNDVKLPHSLFRTGWSSLGAHLEYLSAATSRPIVSDAFRVSVSSPEKLSAPNVGDYLELLRKPSGIRNQTKATVGIARVSHGWMQIRHDKFWRLNPPIIPESLLRPLERRYCAGEQLSLVDFIPLVQTLTTKQSIAASEGMSLFRFTKAPLDHAQGVIRLMSEIGAVPSLAGAGFAYEDLSPTHQSQLRNLLRDEVFDGFVPAKVLPILMNGDYSGHLVKIRFAKQLIGETYFADPQWPQMFGVDPWAVKENSLQKLVVSIDGTEVGLGCVIDQVSPVEPLPENFVRTSSDQIRI